MLIKCGSLKINLFILWTSVNSEKQTNLKLGSCCAWLLCYRHCQFYYYHYYYLSSSSAFCVFNSSPEQKYRFLLGETSKVNFGYYAEWKLFLRWKLILNSILKKFRSFCLFGFCMLCDTHKYKSISQVKMFVEIFLFANEFTHKPKKKSQKNLTVNNRKQPLNRNFFQKISSFELMN